MSLAGEIAGPPMRDLIVARVPATEASLPHPALSDRHRVRVDGRDIVRGGFGGERMSNHNRYICSARSMDDKCPPVIENPATGYRV